MLPPTQNQVQTDVRLFNTTAKRSLKLDEFQTMQGQEMKNKARFLREDWNSSVASTVRLGLQAVGKGHFDINECKNDVYQFSKLKKLLRRINLFMGDTLRICTRRSVEEFAHFMHVSSAPAVIVHTFQDLDITYPLEPVTKPLGMDQAATDALAPEERARLNAVARLQRPPPLFSVEIEVSEAPKCLNQDEVDQRRAEIDAWRPPEDDKEEQCKIEPVEPIVGHFFQYNHAPSEFQTAALDAFAKALASVTDIEQVERILMKKLFWSSVPVVAFVRMNDPNDPQNTYEDRLCTRPIVPNWLELLRRQIESNLGATLGPMEDFRKLLDPYIEFLNLDIDEDIVAKLRPPVEADDDEDQEEAPVDLAKVRHFVDFHRNAMQETAEDIPSQPVNMGLFSVSLVAIRDMLREKHSTIIRTVLAVLQVSVKKGATRLCDDFSKIDRELKKVPKDIEELASVNEYMENVANLIEGMQDSVELLNVQCDILDEFGYEAKEETSMRWRVFGWPKRIHDQMLAAEQVRGARVGGEREKESMTRVLTCVCMLYRVVTNVDFRYPSSPCFLPNCPFPSFSRAPCPLAPMPHTFSTHSPYLPLFR